MVLSNQNFENITEKTMIKLFLSPIHTTPVSVQKVAYISIHTGELVRKKRIGFSFCAFIFKLYLCVRLVILLEDDCGATGFKLLAEITPVEDFLYPIPDDWNKDAEEYRGK